MVITRNRIKGPPMKIAVVADLHGKPTDELYEALKAEKPDIIVCPGDLCTIGEYDDKDDRLVDPERREKRLKTQDGALEFLREAVKIAPTFASRGNHEWGVNDEYRDAVKSTGAVLLENEWVEFSHGIFIGGQNSARCGAKYKDGKLISEDRKEPDIDWLKNSPDGYKVLLSHHPEYYPLIEPYADLILCGHAHGSQIILFGRGLFAPGQGWFPKYTKGVYENKLIVSAGLTNTTWVPRINNPTELVIVEVSP